VLLDQQYNRCIGVVYFVMVLVFCFSENVVNFPLLITHLKLVSIFNVDSCSRNPTLLFRHPLPEEYLCCSRRICADNRDARPAIIPIRIGQASFLKAQSLLWQQSNRRNHSRICVQDRESFSSCTPFDIWKRLCV
jgi:hypothetical protein